MRGEECSEVTKGQEGQWSVGCVWGGEACEMRVVCMRRVVEQGGTIGGKHVE